jgi:hypothetical protein
MPIYSFVVGNSEAVNQWKNTSQSVIPAQAGIQICASDQDVRKTVNKRTGFRVKPGMTARRLAKCSVIQ